ncbi:MAG: hypothetical protein ACR2PD_01245 [Luminiphilus sp.]
MFKVLCLILAALLLTTQASANNLYRYKSDVGGTVVDWQVPAEFAGRVYEALSLKGEALKVVALQLSGVEG